MRKLDQLRARRRSRLRISWFAVVLDLAAIAIAYAVVSLAYLRILDLDQLGRILLSLTPLSLVLNLNHAAYSASVLLDKYRSAWRGSAGLLWATLLMFLIFFFLKISEDFSRVLLGFGTLLAVALISLARMSLADFAGRILGKVPMANLCIYDAIKPGESFADSVIEAGQVHLAPNPDDPAMLELLGRLVSGLDGVVVHCPKQKRAEWAFMLKSLDVEAEIVIPELTELHPLAIRERSGQSSLVLATGQLNWSQRMIKRSFDLLLAIASLPLVVPVLLLIALAIKIDSRGPVLFRQERIGLGNRKFNILKFRTMYIEMQDDLARQSTERFDSRVTRVGQFLRRSSLDELPQIINVIKGDMSIVGPRPHAEQTAVGSALLWQIDTGYWHRHVVKPGITGLAQIRGHRGSLFDEGQLKDRLNADLEYVASWSLASDFRIVIQTLNVIVHKNAF